MEQSNDATDKRVNNVNNQSPVREFPSRIKTERRRTRTSDESADRWTCTANSKGLTVREGSADMLRVSALNIEKKALEKEVAALNEQKVQNQNQRQHEQSRLRHLRSQTQEKLADERGRLQHEQNVQSSSFSIYHTAPPAAGYPQSSSSRTPGRGSEGQLKERLQCAIKELALKSRQILQLEQTNAMLQQKCRLLSQQIQKYHKKIVELSEAATGLKATNRALSHHLEAKNVFLFELCGNYADYSSALCIRSDPMIFHFHLLLQTAKICLAQDTQTGIHELPQFHQANMKALYKSARDEGIQFHDWTKWITVQLTHAHVNALAGGDVPTSPAVQSARRMYFADRITSQEYFRIVLHDYHAAVLSACSATTKSVAKELSQADNKSNDDKD